MEQNDPIVWADTQIANHRAAIADLEAFKRVMLTEPDGIGKTTVTWIPPSRVGLTLGKVAAEGFAKTYGGVSVPTRGAKKLTILDILASGPPQGMKTGEIVASCIERGLVNTTVANTSPQLSAYGQGDDAVVRLHDGYLWKITKKGREYLNQPI